MIFGDTRVGIWDQHKLVYIRIPKSGSTSILGANDGIHTGRTCREIRMPLRQINRLDDSWTVFSFVRNPWARLVSTYTQKAGDQSTSRRLVDGVYKGFIDLGIPVRPRMSFQEFCEFVCDIPDADTDKHLRSQAYTLIRNDKQIIPNIGKMERMNDDWKLFMHKAGLSLELPHRNQTNRKKVHYSSFYPNQALIQKVADRYADDIKYFDYDFEIE